MNKKHAVNLVWY